MSLELRPATAERWTDLAELFCRRGPRGGRPIRYLPMFLAAGFDAVNVAGRRTVVRRRLA